MPNTTTIVGNFKVGQACDSPTDFTIQTKDATGIKITTGGAHFVAKIITPTNNVTFATIRDNNDGTYTGEFFARLAGLYFVDVTLHGVEILGSPFVVQFLAGAWNPLTSLAFGLGLQGPQTYNGTSEFVVEPKDSCGNKAIINEGSLLVTIDGYNGTNGYFIPTLVYNTNGTVTVLYVPSLNGIFQIVVVKSPCNGIRVPPTPTIITVNTNFTSIPTNNISVPCGICTDAFGTGLTIAASNLFQNQFFIQFKDCNDIPVALSGIQFGFQLQYQGIALDPSTYTISSQDLGNGVYPVQYQANIHGPVQLFVSILTNGTENVPGNPYPIYFVDGSSCPHNCTGNGVCISGQCTCDAGFSGSDCSIAPVPFLVSGIFGTTGVTLLFTFSSPTNRGGNGACSSIFDATSVALFGIGNTCRWIDSMNIVVAVGTGATVVVGSKVTLLAHTIQSNTGGQYSSGSVIVSSLPISELHPPVLQLLVPQSLSFCDSYLVAEAGGSLATGGRPLNYDWSYLVSGAQNAQSSLINSILQTISGPNISLSTSLLTPGTYHFFQVTGTSFLGVSTMETFRVYRSNQNSPSVSISSPDELYVFSNQDFSLKAVATIPCANGNSINYAWTRIDLNGPSLQLDLGTSTTATLHIPANTLSANSAFNVEVTVSLDNDLSKLARANITVYVQAPISYAQISFQTDITVKGQVANNRTQARISPIFMDASSSIYADSHPGSFSFQWSCKSLDPPRCGSCLDADARAAYLGNQSTISLPGATLQPGQYEFTVAVTDKTGRIDYANSLVTIVPDQIPLVSIASLGVPAINSNAKLTLTGSAFSVSGTSLSFLWVISTTANQTFVSSLNVKSSILIIPPGTLSEYEEYTFQLYATDSVGTGTASMTIYVYPKPIAGTFSVNPTKGIIGQTQFTLTCNGWEDPSDLIPLQYSFGYVDSSGFEYPLSGSSQLKNYIQTLLPTSAVGVVGYIINSLGVSTRVQVPVTVTLSKKRSNSLLSVALTIEQQSLIPAVQSENQDQLIQAAYLILDLLNDPSEIPNDEELVERQDLRIRVTQDIIGSFNPSNSDDSREAKILLVSKLVNRTDELTISAQYLISQYLASIVGASVQTGINSDDNISIKLATSILTSIGQLLMASKDNTTLQIGTQIGTALTQSLRNTGQALLFGRSIVESAIVIESEFIVLEVKRGTLGTLDFFYSQFNSSIALPKTTITKVLRKRGASLQSQMDSLYIVSNLNVYFWTNTSVDLNTPISLLELTYNNQTFNVTGLSDWVEITLPNVESSEYSLCQFFNESQEMWSFDGCQISPNSTQDVVLCQCNHLSIFSARSAPAPPFKAGGRDAALLPIRPNPPNVNFYTPWWLVVLIGVGLLLILLALAFYKPQNRREIMAHFGISKEEYDLIEPVQPMRALELDEDIYLTRKELLQEESASSASSAELVHYKMPEPESSSEGEIVRMVRAKEEESDEEDLGREKSKIKEESSDGEIEIQRIARRREESSADEGEESRKGPKVHEESSAEEEEEEVARKKKSGKESSSEDEEASRQKVKVVEEESSEEEEISRQKKNVEESSEEDDEILMKKKPTVKEDTDSDEGKKTKAT